MPSLLRLAALFAGSAALLSAQDPAADKAKEAEVKKMISDWKKQVAKLKDDNDVANALSTLGSTQHPLVLKVFEEYLRTGSDRVKKTAAGLIGGYKNDKGAADALVGALSAEATKVKKDKAGVVTGYENAVAILDSIGKVAFRASARKIESYFRNLSTEIARQSIVAVGDIGSIDPVDDMILLMQEIESAAAQYLQPQNPTPAPQSPLKPGKGGALQAPGLTPTNPTSAPKVNSGPSQQELAKMEAQSKMQNVYPAIPQALQKILNYTGQPMKAAAWQAYWSKNKNAFKTKEKEREKADAAAK